MRQRIVVGLCLALATAAAIVLVPPADGWRPLTASSADAGPGAQAKAAGRCSKRFGPYRAGRWPPRCWRPYKAKSPFNRRVPAKPRLLANSAAIVNRLVGWGAVQTMVAGHSESGDDWGHPVYFGRRSSQRYKVKCTYARRDCEVNGDVVRIPGGAKPASAGDGHMAVIDQRSGVEYDFWQVRSKPSGGGTLEVSHGGKTRIDGNGLGSNATAAHFGLAAGIIRGEEVLAREINHALFSQIKCTSGTRVYPAARGTTAAPCSSSGAERKNAPPLGARLWLAMPKSQINALPVPAWKKTILRAMADYGVLVGDTMNGNGSWGLQAESGASYTSFGAKDPWAKLGRRAGVPSDSGGYYFDINSGVDWRRYLRVLHPCVSRGSCRG